MDKDMFKITDKTAKYRVEISQVGDSFGSMPLVPSLWKNVTVNP